VIPFAFPSCRWEVLVVFRAFFSFCLPGGFENSAFLLQFSSERTTIAGVKFSSEEGSLSNIVWRTEGTLISLPRDMN